MGRFSQLSGVDKYGNWPTFRLWGPGLAGLRAKCYDIKRKTVAIREPFPRFSPTKTARKRGHAGQRETANGTQDVCIHTERKSAGAFFAHHRGCRGPAGHDYHSGAGVGGFSEGAGGNGENVGGTSSGTRFRRPRVNQFRRCGCQFSLIRSLVSHCDMSDKMT
jgi:hypothetical protein